MKGLPDKSVDCFLCDLPWGCLANRNTSGGYHGLFRDTTWDHAIDLNEFWIQIKRLAKNDNSPVIMFCNTRFGNDLINSNKKWFRYELVWNKPYNTGFLQANKRPMCSHELIYIFSKKSSFYKRINIPSEPFKNLIKSKNAKPYTIISNERCPVSVISFPRHYGRHPTQKPDEVWEWLIQRYCPENGTVLDPTAGSCRSVIIAKKLGRKGIGIEMDDNYFWKAVADIIHS